MARVRDPAEVDVLQKYLFWQHRSHYNFIHNNNNIKYDEFYSHAYVNTRETWTHGNQILNRRLLGRTETNLTHFEWGSVWIVTSLNIIEYCRRISVKSLIFCRQKIRRFQDCSFQKRTILSLRRWSSHSLLWVIPPCNPSIVPVYTLAKIWDLLRSQFPWG